MIVRVNRGSLKYFKSKARGTKTEIFAIMFGKRLSPHLVELWHFGYPRLKVQTSDAVEPDTESYNDHIEMAEDAGLTFLGTIHSHLPHHEPFMSPCDGKSAHEANELINGLYHVNGRHSCLSFWLNDSPVPCEWDYIR